MKQAVIVGAARTAIGKFLGGFSSLAAPELGAVAVKAVLARAGVDVKDVDEVILGNVLQAGVGQNPARQAALKAGLPPTIAAYTINKVCGSGLKAVALATQAIRAGDGTLYVAGGMESMTNAPYLLRKARQGVRLGNDELTDAMVADGLWDVYEDYHMGNTAELVAREYSVSRKQQDEFATMSHKRAAAAAAAGKFDREIVPVEIPQRKGPPVVVKQDEGVRADASPDSLGKLRPAFASDGTVTAGNASQISDGAAAVVVMEEGRAKSLGLKPLARITGYATGGVEPKWVMMAPIEAVKKLNAIRGTTVDDYDLVELNEAFSSQACAVTKKLNLDPERVNVNGGAVALGHPIGASGCRILVTLLHAMADRNAKTGLATLCLGGGNAVALSVERV
ncbi:MAG TPA: acetyl-CoA C-acetyltransferase [Planctomycetota bacterium]|nr:acetyl-CoA C-acetyltransferase [Planctomycetota bacterium]